MDRITLTKEILKTRLMLSGWYSLIGAFSVPTIVKLQGAFFTSTQLSILLLIPVILRCFQSVLTKLPTVLSLYIPVVLDLLWPLVLILAFLNLKFYVIVEIIVGSLFSILSYNRTMVITELLKEDHSISGFFNQLVSYGAVGAVLGFILSFFATIYLTPIWIFSISTVLAFCVIPYLFKINTLVTKFLLSSEDRTTSNDSGKIV